MQKNISSLSVHLTQYTHTTNSFFKLKGKRRFYPAYLSRLLLRLRVAVSAVYFYCFQIQLPTHQHFARQSGRVLH